VLKNLTPWNDLYFRLSGSDLKDERWNAANFGQQRIKDVRAAVNWLEKHDLSKYNIQSVSTAKLGTVVVGALGGKKSKITVDDFLPFDTRKIKKSNGVTDESIAVLQRLMKTIKIDGRVVAMLAEELKNASSREQTNNA
jgi:hypothetical protein